jgi:hypothetical protein
MAGSSGHLVGCGAFGNQAKSHQVFLVLLLVQGIGTKEKGGRRGTGETCRSSVDERIDDGFKKSLNLRKSPFVFLSLAFRTIRYPKGPCRQGGSHDEQVRDKRRSLFLFYVILLSHIRRIFLDSLNSEIDLIWYGM